MAINKEKKVEILGKLNEAVGSANTLVFVNFHAVPVVLATEIRKTLRDNGVKYFVAKKTLIKKAFGEKGFGGELPELPGEIAVAYGDDQIAPAKGVYEYAKKNPDLLKIVGGVFENKFMNAAEMMNIATIPSRETLYGMFVNVINSPIQGLVIALDAIARKREAVA
ncbi:MAG: 50S ribosomal protein L10 [Candidatus Vogelbacteria bacterium]|nr:50S ribosomal protein L10 [Candidatus Vogelbacteria bacterium]